MTRVMRPSMSLTHIYLYPQAVDFRRSFRGLSAIVECELGHDPFSGHLYAFTNKRRADQFLSTPAQGLVDQIATVAGKLGKGNFVASYQNYSADQASDTIDDLGSEVNFQYTQTVAKHYKVGIKVARYLGNSGRVDADKIWLWVSTKF
jgi:hypothetical protein